MFSPVVIFTERQKTSLQTNIMKEVNNGNAMYQLLSCLSLIILCAAASTPLVKRAYGRISARANEGALLTADIVRVTGICVLSVAFLISGSYNPFLYFRF